MVRIIAAGIVGGLIMFAWGAVSHMVLPLGEMGMSTLPNEQAVLTVLGATVTEPGVYPFPGAGMTPEEIAALPEGPVGLLIVDPNSRWDMSAKMLLTEFLTNTLAALIVAFVAARIAAAYGLRVLMIAVLGLVAWLSISASQWNWYHFPIDFFLAEGIDQFVGWLLSGLAIAAIIPAAMQITGEVMVTPESV